MPFSSNADLPVNIKNPLPSAAQTVWRNVFNEVVASGKSEDSARRIAWTAVKNGWKKNDKGIWVKKMNGNFQMNSPLDFVKIDTDKRLVFGWFSIIENAGEVVVDKQNHIIEEHELEKAVYDYVLNARIVGDMHVRKGVGRLVESIVFTKEKQESLGISLGKVGWWGGFKIDDDDVWKKIKKGEYPSFSIGGRATIEEVED